MTGLKVHHCQSYDHYVHNVHYTLRAFCIRYVLFGHNFDLGAQKTKLR